MSERRTFCIVQTDTWTDGDDSGGRPKTEPRERCESQRKRRLLTKLGKTPHLRGSGEPLLETEKKTVDGEGGKRHCARKESFLSNPSIVTQGGGGGGQKESFFYPEKENKGRSERGGTAIFISKVSTLRS